ncbi:hypothetical protein [Devosia salina]|uniref:Uncharacterized protein n=1 Tax=Devosia salina TaxID=2860336 RepID=A0ABX8WG77_9HYPH|nr:hypothetical protein [Devosia salina]QYO75996.1 hypothetical protein K1X15_15390 [Devosia salina]
MSIARGDSLNAWELSPVEARHFPGEPAPARDPQNYKYINGFVDVGDLPCRVATWREVAARNVSLRTDWPVESLYLPGNNRRVEFSQFRHRPTRLARWCRTRLVAPEDRYCSFRLSTRGGVHIWVDGVLAARFEPFTRNQTQETVVHLPLKAGGSDVIVLTEDMAERDVNWFFELVLLDDVRLDVFLEGARLGRNVEALKALSSQVRTRGDVISGAQDVVLAFDTPARIAVDIVARISTTSHTHATLLDRTLHLPAGATSVTLCSGTELPDGYHTLDLTFVAGDSRVDRSIGCPILHDIEPSDIGPDLASRKARALEHAALHGEMRMGTATAILATGRADDPRLRPIIEDTLLAIEERRDCADFVSVPLLWAWIRHQSDFPSDLAERTRRALLEFRYWVDEPGNDVMWFWSENHALCFHVSQLLAGLSFPEAVFACSGRTGAQQAALATERLGLWLDSVEEEGLAEWNSAAYYPVDFIGLLALVELAPEPIAGRAKVLCDRIFTMVALHTLGGVPAGSMGRAYDKELRAGPLTELAPFAAVAFGTGWLNTGVASLPLFAAGGYESPAEIGAYVAPDDGQVVTARYTQGYGEAAQLSLYKTRYVQLSSNSGARAGGYGHQQHVLDLRFASHPMARSWLNHPGEDDPWGQQRPSYWAGNGVLPRVGQHRNAAMALFRLGATARLDFSHVYAAQAGLVHHLDGDTLILEGGKGLVAYKALGPLVAMENGPCAGIEYRLTGPDQGWAVIVAENQDLEAFTAYVRRCRLRHTGGESLVLERPDNARLTLDWTRGLLIGEAQAQEPFGGVVPSIALERL